MIGYQRAAKDAIGRVDSLNTLILVDFMTIPDAAGQ
ncbi:hypothetical protein MPC4_70085 [Methylocella tundrae]|uniref:Uncharacterized protein n=1 Tax=Methylocella tundrae TaxID=227605 RepID=A0A8B6MAY5_METTU|nr:hypothetical protein MPC4_70085 [Methylocella tundrae]